LRDTPGGINRIMVGIWADTREMQGIRTLSDQNKADTHIALNRSSGRSSALSTFVFKWGCCRILWGIREHVSA